MVCQECVILILGGYRLVHPNRSGLMTQGMHRVKCSTCKPPKEKLYEKIIDEKRVLPRDKLIERG